MRIRMKAFRVQVAERVVSATDTESALQKVRDELAQPYGLLGRWETIAVEVEVVDTLSPLGSGAAVMPESPMLLSVRDAAKVLGLSAGTVYQLLNSGELESVQIGRRRLISRDGMVRFIEANTHPGR